MIVGETRLSLGDQCVDARAPSACLGRNGAAGLGQIIGSDGIAGDAWGIDRRGIVLGLGRRAEGMGEGDSFVRRLDPECRKAQFGL